MGQALKQGLQLGLLHRDDCFGEMAHLSKSSTGVAARKT